MTSYIDLHGVRVPRFFYGTAWKEDETKRLTLLALQEGFRGIDTANQRKHYFEAAVGEAVASALQGGIAQRDELFLQTKFTFRGGQDRRLPYDPSAPIATQVEQSFASSLEHLGVTTIDSYILHGPSRSVGLGDPDWQAWRAIESIYDSGRARLIGVSNVSAEQLKLLCDHARVPPHLVQNRCYANRQWDVHVRTVCSAHQVTYQGFSLLTANRQVLADPRLVAIAGRHGRTPQQIVFRFAFLLGMICLTGTTNAAHMREDLAVLEFELERKEVEQIETMAMSR